MILLFTLLEILGFIALLLILGALVAGIYFAKQKVNSASSTLGGAVTVHKLELKDPPPKNPEIDIEFPKNTRSSFKFLLTKYNAGGQRYEGFDGEDSFVGIVEPASISIISINGNPPGTAELVDLVPVTAYRTSSASDGTVTIILEGSEPADGMLSVFYVSSSEGLLTAQSDFSITDE